MCAFWCVWCAQRRELKGARARGCFLEGGREALAACADQDATGKRDKGEQLFIITALKEGGWLVDLQPLVAADQCPPHSTPRLRRGRFSGGGGAGAAPVDMNPIWERAQG